MRRMLAITLLSCLLFTGCSSPTLHAEQQQQPTDQQQNSTPQPDQQQPVPSVPSETPRQKEIRLLDEYLRTVYDPNAKPFNYFCLISFDSADLLKRGYSWSTYNDIAKENIAGDGVNAWYYCGGASQYLANPPLNAQETASYLDDLFAKYPEDQQFQILYVIRGLMEYKLDGQNPNQQYKDGIPNDGGQNPNDGGQNPDDGGQLHSPIKGLRNLDFKE